MEVSRLFARVATQRAGDRLGTQAEQSVRACSKNAAVLLHLLAPFLGLVYLRDLSGGEGPPHLVVELEADGLGLPDVLHVAAWPELVPLVEVDVEYENCENAKGTSGIGKGISANN